MGVLRVVPGGTAQPGLSGKSPSLARSQTMTKKEAALRGMNPSEREDSGASQAGVKEQ